MDEKVLNEKHEEELSVAKMVKGWTKYISHMGTSDSTASLILDSASGRARPSMSITPEALMKLKATTNPETLRAYSKIMYAHPLYRRIIDYFATMLLNQYFITPLLADVKKNQKKALMQDYNSVLRIVDEDLQIEKITSRILTDLLIEGKTFYCRETYEKNGEKFFKLVKLPTQYCEIEGTAGTPAVNIVSVDLSFIDIIKNNALAKGIWNESEILSQYPKAIREAYNKYKNSDGDLANPASKLVVLPTNVGVGFSTNNQLPPFAFLIKQLARIEKFETLRDDYLETNLTKVLVQQFDLDKDGTPELDLAMAAEFHKNLKAIAAKKPTIDALTTLAKVEVLSLGEKGDQKNTHEFLKTFYDQMYSDGGISEELFNSSVRGTLDISERKDEAFVLELRKQIETWVNFFLNSLKKEKVIKTTDFVFSYLDTSYRNREKMTESFLKSATYGYGKMMPQIALGVKQRYLQSLSDFENDFLGYGEKLIPLKTSHTQDGTSDSVEKKNGRPEKTMEEKEDSTIAKEIGE